MILHTQVYELPLQFRYLQYRRCNQIQQAGPAYVVDTMVKYWQW